MNELGMKLTQSIRYFSITPNTVFKSHLMFVNVNEKISLI